MEEIAVLPPLEQVARGMGKVLAQLHWGVGVDGMDAELVLGGTVYMVSSAGCWTITSAPDG